MAWERVRFDRRELAGAFGDIGTDLPLLVALIVTCGLDAASVFAVFGVLQIATGLVYGIPMPVQPLKAMAAIMLVQRLPAGTLAGGGLVIGAAMLLLALTGLLDRLARAVPKEVVRGLQLGLGLTLASLALKEYVPAEGLSGYALAILCAAALLAHPRESRVPAPLIVIGLGLAYAILTNLGHGPVGPIAALRLPAPVVPTRDQLAQGALLLALPQIALSLGNSVIATSQASRDLFPGRSVPVRKIGVTYGLMNLVAPWLGGVPVCHGCGGLVGFYGFGARTGGAPVLYGSLYLVLGLFFSPAVSLVLRVFPLPVLGVVLLFEAVALMTLIRDVARAPQALWVALAVAAMVIGLPYGYAVGLVAGMAIVACLRRGWARAPSVLAKERPMMTGVVRWFDDERGIALLARDDNGEDAFCPFGAILEDGCFKKIAPGQRVEFEVLESPEGAVAGNVRRVFDDQGVLATRLCANAVQVRTRSWGEVDLPSTAERLRQFGDVRLTPVLLRLRAPPHDLTLFDDGRAIVKGTDDVEQARGLVRQWLGVRLPPQ